KKFGVTPSGARGSRKSSTHPQCLRSLTKSCAPLPIAGTSCSHSPSPLSGRTNRTYRAFIGRPPRSAQTFRPEKPDSQRANSCNVGFSLLKTRQARPSPRRVERIQLSPNSGLPLVTHSRQCACCSITVAIQIGKQRETIELDHRGAVSFFHFSET